MYVRLQSCSLHRVPQRSLGIAVALIVLFLPAVSYGQAGPPPTGLDDHQNMMDQLGIKALRRGPDPNNQSTFDEATANLYKDSMPDVLKMKDGTKVTRARQWPRRRAEILEDFEREVYGRIPKNVPKVTWEMTATTPGEAGGIPTVTKTLIGHVDNSAYPQISVNIRANFTVPASTKKPVPIMIEFGFGFNRPGFVPAWKSLAISKGWGYGEITPTSVQPDNNQLRTGIIGLTNKGQPRKPDDWGALRAWQWGVSRMIDYFEASRDSLVDPTKVGIEGLSRYGKAAIVTEAFDPRVAVGLIGSSGEGGVKLHRHIFGEAVESLAGGEYYWMAGNFIKYGASDPPKTAADLPVDSHELIALCAPRPCFISYGVVEHGDAKWVDAHGSFMAAVLAGPVYQLLGKKDLGTAGNYLTDPMPPIKTLIGGELAWRQHEGGHDVTPNWPSFFDWVQTYIKAPALPAAASEQTGRSAEQRQGLTSANQAALPAADSNTERKLIPNPAITQVEIDAILARAIKALGGEENLNKAKLITWKAKTKITFNDMTSEWANTTIVQGLTQFKQELEGKFGNNPFKTVTLLNKDKGSLKFGENTTAMNQEAVANQKRTVYLTLLPMIILPLRDSEYKKEGLDEINEAGKSLVGIKVTAPDKKSFDLYFDKATGLPQRLIAHVTGFQPNQEFNQETMFNDYKEMAGIQIAARVVIKNDGKPFMEHEITDFKLLDSADPKTFGD